MNHIGTKTIETERLIRLEENNGKKRNGIV